MSEGDHWVHKTVHDIGLLLRDEHSSPVSAAEDAVRKFGTRELRSAPNGFSGVEEYFANAALDLVIMAAWSVAGAQIGADPLPVSLE
jgi:hypothetical protein